MFNRLLLIVFAISCLLDVDLIAADRPNVILIITDDQGYGDFGATGNDIIETPNLDELASRSASMSTFYVSPVCSPTRACLMTGRYNYRTRCIDTFVGRSMMEPNEITIAEVLAANGYRNGLFGKWHLGDCYPMRPQDQGFHEVLMHKGGGLGQPSDPRENNRRYTDPILFHNGEQVNTKGYCTDVYFDAALSFIETEVSNGNSFFTYIATNAPHGPFHDVPEDLLAHYQQKDMGSLIVGKRNEQQRKAEVDRLARIAAMITNVDQNVGRLFAKLDELDVRDNTLVIFIDDNGPNTRRYVGDFRGNKSMVYDGGVRSPCWLHWPNRLQAGVVRDELSAHIDLLPTIADACNVRVPRWLKLDGQSFLPLLEGKRRNWNRHLVLQAHRGNEPVRYHNFMLRHGDWKLLHSSGFGNTSFDGKPQFQLYDVSNDPTELNNLASTHPEQVARLQRLYDQWFDDVSTTREDNYAPPRIVIGSDVAPETVLSRQDWRDGTWAPNSSGYWEVNVVENRSYDIEVVFNPAEQDETLEIRLETKTVKANISAGDDRALIRGVPMENGPQKISAVLLHLLKDESEKIRGPYQVIIRPHL